MHIICITNKYITVGQGVPYFKEIPYLMHLAYYII